MPGAPLTLFEREEIGLALLDDRAVAWAVIARRIRRHPTTVSREIEANGGRRAYRRPTRRGAWAPGRRRRLGVTSTASAQWPCCRSAFRSCFAWERQRAADGRRQHLDVAGRLGPVLARGAGRGIRSRRWSTAVLNAMEQVRRGRVIPTAA